MDEETWRPLGVDTEDQVAQYDALHEGVPEWMEAAYWSWVRRTLTTVQRGSGAHYRTTSAPTFRVLNCELTEQMCQSLQIPLPDMRRDAVSADGGKKQLTAAVNELKKHVLPLQIADYLVAHEGRADAGELEGILTRSRSAFMVGARAGRPGLTRRVPVGVQVGVDSIMARSGRAGVRLAEAWERLYGLKSDPGAAYSLAIKAVEDASVPFVMPGISDATLGKVLNMLRTQGDWKLPMEREHEWSQSPDVLIGMIRMLWHGQHDRHGGPPSVPGNVSVEEATVAVSLAVTLVNLFTSGLVRRESQPA